MIDLHHEVTGADDAPPLVLSNSLGSNLSMWDPQLPALAERFRVVRYDQRGHGRSPVPAGPYSIDDVGADAVALLDRLGIERAHFCGLSLGGMTGMWLGINAPERVDRLALLCTSAKLGPPENWAERAALVREKGTAAIADAGLQRWVTDEFVAANPEKAEWLRRMMLDTPDEGYAGCCEVIQHMDLEPRLGEIRAPTLVIAGDEDPATPPGHAERIAAAVAGARVEVVSPGRHLANVERAEEITALLLEHLEG
ncbi:MAG TPA: 3-oxoadipate enol-lactonase [Solirubrobacteraceae bacterium]|jgi:3-oxoadipate enol-lactonase